ncbi:C-5 cytosine-specific DNA methylase [Chytridiales sp. JEL 0842]|nr:C-5 cytosine-specific DNA methylase [Chytridiales sp. JEL 0842]
MTTSTPMPPQTFRLHSPITTKSEIRALEFFSGIGGLHYGLEFSLHQHATVLASFDISPVPNLVGKHNFGKPPVQYGIDALTAEEIDAYGANCWLLSPPCQPYTRGGKKLDDKDPRAKGLLNLINLIKALPIPPQFILMENVKNFEESRSRDLLIAVLAERGYEYDEWILTPLQFGIPNERKRYYLTARLIDLQAPRKEAQESSTPPPPPLRLRRQWPFEVSPPLPPPLSDFIDPTFEGGLTAHVPSSSHSVAKTTSGEPKDKYKLPEAFVRNRKFISTGYVVSPQDRRSACFTKAYGKHGIGAGAYLMTKGFDAPRDVILGDPVEAAQTLGLRFFTPVEIARLHAFPIDDRAPQPHYQEGVVYKPLTPFRFPDELSLVQRYRVLGNSLNVKVVGELLRCVVFNDSWKGCQEVNDDEVLDDEAVDGQPDEEDGDDDLR